MLSDDRHASIRPGAADAACRSPEGADPSRGLFIVHLALGGCVVPEPVPYGATEDTGGHIAYLLGAAAAQARQPGVARVDILTRRFAFGALPTALARECARVRTPLAPRLTIHRLTGQTLDYLSKEALRAEIPALTEAMIAWVHQAPRRPDVIHAHFSDAAAIALRLRARFGIPVIYTPHSLGADKTPSGDPAYRRRLADERRALARSDATVVSSRDEAERQIGLYPGAALGRVHQIRPGIAPAAAASAHPKGRALLARHLADPGKPFVLSIARPVAKKNLPALAEAYAASPDLQARANLVILAGQRLPGWGCAEQRAQIARVGAALTGLDGRVALPDLHSRAEVADLYALAAAQGGVFVNPARVEPFGLTTLEAAAAGLPCIVPVLGGAAEVVAGIGHGVAVSSADPAALAGAILDLMRPDTHARLSLAARRAAPGLGWDGYAARLGRVIDSLVKAPAAAPARALRPAAGRPAARVAGPVRGTLLVCDIDNTLTGDRRAVPGLRRLIETTPSLAFAIATGRSVSEARRVLADWDLPEPEALITSAGSEIHRPDAAGRLTEDRRYARQSRIGFCPRRIAAALDGLPGLTPQPEVEQRAGKLGYLGPPRVAALIRARLAQAGLPATVLHSHGRLIDVMGPIADKGHAVAWLARMLGVPDGRVVVAGDSGNDIAMLDNRWNAILIGADPDLRSIAAGPRRYRARAAHAAGVVEGLSFFDARLQGSAA